MPIPSRWAFPVPEVSLQKWVFGSSFVPLSRRKVFLDPDQPETRFLTMAQFRLLSKRIALGLQRAGLQRGDRVLLFTGNTLFFPAILMGVLMAGGVFTGASPAFTARELAYQLQDSGASFAIAGSEAIDVALEGARLASLSQDRVFALDRELDHPATPGKTRHWAELIAPAKDALRFDWVEPADPHSAPCCLNYSSGTTGPPKGVEITHYAYVANGEAVVYLSKMRGDWEAWLRRQRGLCYIPMYHAAGQTIFAANMPRLGIPVYIMEGGFSLERLLRYVQELRITSLPSVPPVLLALAKSPAVAQVDMSSVEDILCGTAPLAPDIKEAVDKRLWPDGSSFVRQGWGMTEMTCVGTLWAHDDLVNSASVGEIVPNSVGKIVGSDGREVTAPNERGEMWFTGPTLMKGYWNNAKATGDTFTVDEDGTRWLRTGDIVTADRLGPGAKIRIVDRIKELIKSKGYQVSPSELEDVLLQHAHVVDAGVVGVVIDNEEAPRAYVVLDSPGSASEEELQDWMKSRLAKYKWPRGGIAIIDAIPRIQSGKILRRELRERAAKEVGDTKAKL